MLIIDFYFDIMGLALPKPLPMHTNLVRKSARLTMLSVVLLMLINCSPGDEKKFTTWKVTGGSKANIRYSTLTQIDTSNVKNLQVAWSYSIGDADTINNSQIQCNPIIVDGILYGTSPQLKLLTQ